MFDPNGSALVPLKAKQLTETKTTAIASIGGTLLSSIEDQKQRLSRDLIYSPDTFETRLIERQLSAWRTREGMVHTWMEEREERELALLEQFLQYRCNLSDGAEALELLASVEGISPQRLRDDYQAFRTFMLQPKKLVVAQRVARKKRLRDLEARLAEYELRETELRHRLKEADLERIDQEFRSGNR